MATSLTILVPTHNRPDVLEKVWPSWLGQEGLVQVVIVNDGSSDDYSQVLSDLYIACNELHVQLDIIETDTRIGAPAAKNLGLDKCIGSEILTTDDDILLPDSMVANCRKFRPNHSGPVLIGPRVIYLKDGEKEGEALARAENESRPYFDTRRLLLCPWANPGEVREYPFVTAIVLWPADLFQSGLRFYEGYGGNGYREETDPQLNAAMNFGAKIFLAHNAHCFHLPPEIAYAKKGGQRRGGRLWFEYWVLRNNFVFLKRFAPYLKGKFKIHPISTWLYLAASRLSPERILKVLKL